MSDQIIYPPFVKKVPATEIPITEDPLNGHILNYNTLGKLTLAPIASFRKNIMSGIKGEATPTSSPTAWASGDPDLYEKWDVKTAGTYTNFKDNSIPTPQPIVVTSDDLADNFVQIWVHNGVSQKVTSEKPQAENRIDTWVAGDYDTGRQVIYADQSIYEANENTTSSDVPGISVKWTKKVSGGAFSEKMYSATVDLSIDNYVPYKKILGNVLFTEGVGSKFGKMSFYKLTGGNVSFASNFKEQPGSSVYNPNLTNVISLWKEYDKVKYFIEIFPYENIPIDTNIITEYSFSGTPGTLLNAIPPLAGASAIGNTAGNGLINTGLSLGTTNVGGFELGFGFNLGSIVNYKITISGLVINGFFDVLINVSTPNDGTKDYFSFRKNPPAYSHVQNGVAGAFQNFTSSFEGDMVIEVVGNKISCKSNGVDVFNNVTLMNSGGSVGFLLGDTGYSFIQGLKIEKL